MNHLIIAVLNSRKFITINLGAGMDKQKIATPQAFNKNTYKLIINQQCKCAETAVEVR